MAASRRARWPAQSPNRSDAAKTSRPDVGPGTTNRALPAHRHDRPQAMSDRSGVTDARSIRFRHFPVKPRLAPCRTIRSAPTIARKPPAGRALPLSRQRSSLAALLPRRPRHPHGQMEPGGDGTSRGCFVAKAIARLGPRSASNAITARATVCARAQPREVASVLLFKHANRQRETSRRAAQLRAPRG